MSVKHIAGETDPFVTSRGVERSDRDSTIVEVTGRYIDLKTQIPAKGSTGNFVPEGYVCQSANLQSTGDGMGVLRISCTNYGEADISTLPERTTFSVDMVEVQQDLQCHPKIKGDKDALGQALKWLATEEKWRFNPEGDEQEMADPKNAKYRYADADWDGTETGLKIVTATNAQKFCAAWVDGIHTFNRYYPIVVKRGTYKRLPGASMSGASTTGGTVPFTSSAGKFEVPPLHLNGWKKAGHWFKGKDTWEQNADTTWTRTEQWIYTPVTTHNWIYDDIDPTEDSTDNGEN